MIDWILFVCLFIYFFLCLLNFYGLVFHTEDLSHTVDPVVSVSECCRRALLFVYTWGEKRNAALSL